MQHASRITRLTALALGITGALAIGQAHASGFQIRENSVKNLGRAFSGSTVAQNDASVVANNPAAMVNIDRVTVQADASVIDLTADFEGGGTTALGTPLNGGDGGDPGDASAVPAMAVVIPLSGSLERMTVGASVSAPFGLKTEYDSNWVGRYNAIESDVKTINLTLSAAVEVTERFSVGIGLMYQRAEVTLTNAIDIGTQACVGSGNPANCFNPAFPYRPQANDALVEVSGDDNGIGWIIGAQWRPTDSLSLGFSHRSEIDHDLEGDADFSSSNAAAQVILATNPGLRDGKISAPLTTPSVTTFSAQYDINDSFRLMADVQATDWHSLEAVNIYRPDGSSLGHEAFDWEDTMLYSLGGEYDINDSFTVRAGVALDETPTNDLARTPRLPDQDRNIFSLGMTWNVSEQLSVDAAFMRIEIEETKVNVLSSSRSRLVGEFDGYANVFGVAAQYRF
ncbi:OmpP1/FadL family transporter [Montanilutibacter psychrotolerans]|nr:outer membrane protein transport protein [Lysobacter psychrotolerans]